MFIVRLTAVLFLIAIAVNVFSEESALSIDDDPFNTAAFDSAVTQVTTASDLSKLTYLGGVSFVSDATVTYLTGTQNNGSDIRFYGKPFIKVTKNDIGSLFLSASFNYYLMASTNSPYLKQFYTMQKADPSKIQLNLSEFHLSFDFNKLIFIRLGNQLISWGASYFWSPEDFINRQKTQLSAINAVDIRSGKPGLKIHIPFENSNLFFFTDFSKITNNGTINSFSDNIAQAWRFDATISNINVGTVGYVSSKNPLQLGFDATGNVLSADVYGELALTFDDDSDELAPVLSSGFSKTFGMEKTWTFRSEFYYNKNGFDDTLISVLPRGSFTPLYSGKYYLFTELSTSKLFTTMVSSTLLYYMNLADLSFSSTLLFNIDLPNILPFTIYTKVNGGKPDREFTSALGDRSVTAGFRIRGEF